MIDWSSRTSTLRSEWAGHPPLHHLHASSTSTRAAAIAVGTVQLPAGPSHRAKTSRSRSSSIRSTFARCFEAPFVSSSIASSALGDARRTHKCVALLALNLSDQDVVRVEVLDEGTRTHGSDICRDRHPGGEIAFEISDEPSKFGATVLQRVEYYRGALPKLARRPHELIKFTYRTRLDDVGAITVKPDEVP